MGPGHYRKAAPSDGYYEEVWEVVIMPEGSRSQPGTLTGVGPGLCGLPRISIPRTTVNRGEGSSPSPTHAGDGRRAVSALVADAPRLSLWYFPGP